MNKIKLGLIFICISITSVFAQNQSDSIILFSDLKFHSKFEKESMQNFLRNNTDTFNFFLAID